MTTSSSPWVPPKTRSEALDRRAKLDKKRAAIWEEIKADRVQHGDISTEKLARLHPLNEESERLTTWISRHKKGE